MRNQPVVGDQGVEALPDTWEDINRVVVPTVDQGTGVDQYTVSVDSLTPPVQPL